MVSQGIKWPTNDMASHGTPAARGGSVNRRRFLRAAGGIAGGAVGLLAAPLPAAALGEAPRELALRSIHTGEFLRATYWEAGAYVPEALAAIDWHLRDHRTGDVHRIDPRLLDVLHLVHSRLESRKPFRVISGYRSPKTNRMLAARSHGVAKRSLHMSGLAIDVNLPDRALRTLRQTALSLKLGGVGYYPRSGFVHLDLGRPRTW